MESSVHTLEHAAHAGNGSWRSEARLLLRQSLPNILTSLLRMGMTVTDFVMVSQLGTDAQAAVSPASLFCFIIVAAGMAVASTVTTFAAQAVGRGEPREAAAFAWQSIYLAGFFSLFSWPLMYAMDPLFSLFQAEPGVRAMQVAFCKVGVWSVGPTIVAAGIEGFFTAIKRPIIGTAAILVALAWNVLGNYMLIHGHFGAPRMGIAGSSLSTVIAWSLRAAILLSVFFAARYATAFGTRTQRAPSLDRMRRLIRIGAPTAVQWVLDIGAWFIFMELIMGRFGKSAMAGANIGLQYMHFSFMPAIGIGIALCALVGHAIGEGRHELAVRRTQIAMSMVGAYMGMAGLVFLLCRYPFMRLFSRDAGVVELGALMLIWAAIFQVFDGIGIVYTNALRGAGDTRFTTVAYVISGWVVFIGGGLLAMRYAPGLGVHGPWAACTLYIILLGLALWWRWRHGPWRKIRLFDAAPRDSLGAADTPAAEVVPASA